MSVRLVLIRDPTGRFPHQALLYTNLKLEHTQIGSWLVWHSRVEMSFEQVRRHLGVESQRQ